MPMAGREFMESIIRDVLFALRSLKRQPAFAITAVLTIATASAGVNGSPWR